MPRDASAWLGSNGRPLTANSMMQPTKSWVAIWPRRWRTGSIDLTPPTESLLGWTSRILHTHTNEQWLSKQQKGCIETKKKSCIEIPTFTDAFLHLKACAHTYTEKHCGSVSFTATWPQDNKRADLLQIFLVHPCLLNQSVFLYGCTDKHLAHMLVTVQVLNYRSTSYITCIFAADNHFSYTIIGNVCKTSL